MTILALIIGAQYGAIADIEVVWTAIAAVGLIFSIYNWRDAEADYKALGVLANGRRAIAVLSIKMEITRTIIQGLFLAIGISAMFVPDAPDQLHRPTNVLILSVLFRWGLVISAILIMYQSIANYHVRKKLIESDKASRG